MTLDLIGSKCRYLKDSCPREIWQKVKSEFIRANSDILKSTTLSWFLPEWLGGLGLPIDDYNTELSAFDRKMASCIKFNYQKNNYCPISLGSAAEWQTHRLVKKIFNIKREDESFSKNFIYHKNTYDVEEKYNQFYKKAVLYIFFTQPIATLHRLNKSGDRQVKAAIKRNEQIVTRCSREINKNHIKYPEMAEEDMQFEQKKTFPILFHYNNLEHLQNLGLPFAFHNPMMQD